MRLYVNHETHKSKASTRAKYCCFSENFFLGVLLTATFIHLSPYIFTFLQFAFSSISVNWSSVYLLEGIAQTNSPAFFVIFLPHHTYISISCNSLAHTLTLSGLFHCHSLYSIAYSKSFIGNQSDSIHFITKCSASFVWYQAIISCLLFSLLSHSGAGKKERTRGLVCVYVHEAKEERNLIFSSSERLHIDHQNMIIALFTNHSIAVTLSRLELSPIPFIKSHSPYSFTNCAVTRQEISHHIWLYNFPFHSKYNA